MTQSENWFKNKAKVVRWHLLQTEKTKQTLRTRGNARKDHKSKEESKAQNLENKNLGP